MYDKWLVGSFCNPGFLRFGESFKYGSTLNGTKMLCTTSDTFTRGLPCFSRRGGRYDYRAWAAPELPWEALLMVWL